MTIVGLYFVNRKNYAVIAPCSAILERIYLQIWGNGLTLLLQTAR